MTIVVQSAAQFSLAGVYTWSGVQTFSAIPVLSGGAITFPATQVPSAGANTLDDYEEGAWTPALKFGGNSTSLTYSNQSGTYTKIGRLVHAYAEMSLSAKGSSTGAATITGITFAAATGSPASLYMDVMTSGVGDTMLTCRLVTSTLSLYKQSAGNLASLAETDFTNTSTIILSVVYSV